MGGSSCTLKLHGVQAKLSEVRERLCAPEEHSPCPPVEENDSLMEE